MRSTVTTDTFLGALFDMDGTLIDSTASGEAAWRVLADQWQFEDPEFLATIHGKPARETLLRVVGAADLDAAVEELERLECENVDGITALPGAKEILEAIPEDRKALVTSGFFEVVLARLGAAGITPLRHMVTCESITNGKPDPEPFRTGAEILGLAPAQTVAFEDTVPGIQSARAAGCVVVAVPGTRTADELADADYVVQSLSDIEVLSVYDGFRLQISQH